MRPLVTVSSGGVAKAKLTAAAKKPRTMFLLFVAGVQVVCPSSVCTRVYIFGVSASFVVHIGGMMETGQA